MNAQIEISFDYNNDQITTPPSPPSVTVYDPSLPSTPLLTLKNGGFLRAWGKEIDEFDTTKPGGLGLGGQWLKVAREITLVPHPLDSLVTVLGSVRLAFDVDDLVASVSSPFILAFTLAGINCITMIHKDSAVGAFPTSDLVGGNLLHHIDVDGVLLPSPIHAAWTSLPGWNKQVWMPSDVSNKADIDIDITCSTDLSIGLTIIDARNIGIKSNIVSTPLPVDKFPMLAPAFYGQLQSATSAFGAMVEFGFQNVQAGNLVLDKLSDNTSSMWMHSLGSDVGNVQPPVKPNPIVFVPPPDLELPTLPAGYEYAINLRGLIFIGKTLVDSEPLWPTEVFDLEKMYKSRDAMRSDANERAEFKADEIEREIERVKALFEYQASIAESIARVNRIFASLNL